MIGNARDPSVVQRHLNKMFAGINALICGGENGREVLGVISREGECVDLLKAIQVGPSSTLMGWLRALEDGVSTSLGNLLDESLRVLSPKVPSTEEAEHFFKWFASFPTQLVILSSQIRSVNGSMAV